MTKLALGLSDFSDATNLIPSSLFKSTNVSSPSRRHSQLLPFQSSWVLSNVRSDPAAEATPTRATVVACLSVHPCVCVSRATPIPNGNSDVAPNNC